MTDASSLDPKQIRELRERHLGKGLSLSYAEPLTIVRGQGAYLYDDDGNRYLDCVNNVCHVGHCHPHVVAAARAQIGDLNTNTRYLHPSLATYAERLTSKFPDPLSVCYLVCTGSEAVDLALRLARNATGSDSVVAVEAGYHGNTRATVEVSHYKFAGPGGAGAPPATQVAPMPCTYRGEFRDPNTAGAQYAQQAVEAVRRANGPTTFLSESMLSVGGQIMLPKGYLAPIYESVRERGGLCIADEVQVGFGRCGSHWSSFEMQGVTPDLVTLGKPMGNGHPMAAVITTPEISAQFDNGMEYFNTFGGNPVSCAIGHAVLDVIEQENLLAHALDLGHYLLRRLRELTKFPLVGDIRGQGMFLGLELVRDRGTQEPAVAAARTLVELMKERGVLLSVDGPLYNVIKIKPPLPFSRVDADELVDKLAEVLAHLR